MSDGASQLELGPNALLGLDEDGEGDSFDGMLRGLDNLVVDPGVEVDESAGRPAEPLPSGRSLEPEQVAPRPSVRGDGLVAFPLLDGDDGPCLLRGPFLCADMGDGDPVPVISVYEPARPDVLNSTVRATNRAFLGCITHDATEADLLKHFGPGAYQLAVRKEGGGYLKWGRVQVGRVGPVRRQVAMVAQVGAVSPGLGGLGGQGGAQAPRPADPVLAELQKLNARLDKLEAGPAANGFDVQIRTTMDNAETALRQLDSLGELGDKLVALKAKLRGSPVEVSADDEPEEEAGLIDGAAETLGNALMGAQKLKTTMQQFKLLMGAG